jgi:hypothetical protein
VTDPFLVVVFIAEIRGYANLRCEVAFRSSESSTAFGSIEIIFVGAARLTMRVASRDCAA